MKRYLAVAFILLCSGACDERPTTAPAAASPKPNATRVGAPAPSPLVPVALSGQTLQLWPFSGFGFGQPSDPVSLIWIRRLPEPETAERPELQQIGRAHV